MTTKELNAKLERLAAVLAALNHIDFQDMIDFIDGNPPKKQIKSLANVQTPNL